jgi:hypothetical protein
MNRAAFDAEVRRMVATFKAKVAEGKLDPGVAIGALLIAALEIAEGSGMMAEVGAWLRNALPADLDAARRAADRKPH